MEHGLYIERLDNMVCPGATGFDKMKNIMNCLQTSPPKNIGGNDVTAVLDYNSLERLDLVTGTTSPIDCISGNVMVLEFGDIRNRITIRPSGTEPKLKFYVQWFEDVDKSISVVDQYDMIENKLEKLASDLEQKLLDL